MPFLEYILVALLGSTSVTASGGIPGSPWARTLNAEGIVQPNGGTLGEVDFNSANLLCGQCTGGDKSIKGLPHHGGGKKVVSRRHRTGHRRGKHRRRALGGGTH